MSLIYMDCSIVITDQYYENSYHHVTTMASEGKDLMISYCNGFFFIVVDSHNIMHEASATQMTHVRLI